MLFNKLCHPLRRWRSREVRQVGGIEGAGGAGCRSLGSALCVYKILKMELECVRHCDRIWIMVVKYIKIYLTTV